MLIIILIRAYTYWWINHLQQELKFNAALKTLSNMLKRAEKEHARWDLLLHRCALKKKKKATAVKAAPIFQLVLPLSTGNSPVVCT